MEKLKVPLITLKPKVTNLIRILVRIKENSANYLYLLTLKMSEVMLLIGTIFAFSIFCCFSSASIQGKSWNEEATIFNDCSNSNTIVFKRYVTTQFHAGIDNYLEKRISELSMR